MNPHCESDASYASRGTIKLVRFGDIAGNKVKHIAELSEWSRVRWPRSWNVGLREEELKVEREIRRVDDSPVVR